MCSSLSGVVHNVFLWVGGGGGRDRGSALSLCMVAFSFIFDLLMYEPVCRGLTSYFSHGHEKRE